VYGTRAEPVLLLRPRCRSSASSTRRAILDSPSSCSGTKSNIDLEFHLDSGKWAVVTGFQAIKDDDDVSRCQAVVEKDLDSAPSSCE
jgi:hypothetical protein